MSHKKILFVIGFICFIFALVVVGFQSRQTTVRAEPLADPITNIACLPFPESDITSYNGQKEATAVNTHDQTTITWKDDAGTAEGYTIQRRTVSTWTDIATVAADKRLYTDTGLNDTLYDYRVWRIVGGENEEVSDYCTRPDYVQSGEFIVFYRLGPSGCPSVDDDDGSNRGTCVTSVNTANDILDYLERSRAGYATYMSFQDPFNAGNMPYPVDLFPCDGVGGARSGYICLTPGSMEPSGFNALTGDGETAVWTVLHEVFHKVQGMYGTWSNTEPDRKWITEGTARSIQDKICIGPNGGDCISLDDVDPSGYNNQVIKYLTQSHHINLMDSSYNTALFWTKVEEICDDPGSTAAEREIDFLLAFFEEHQSFPNTIGRDVVSDVLQNNCNTTLSFETLFERFAVANYAKEFTGAPSIYQYEDEATMTNGYGPVTVDYAADMDGGDELVGSGWVQPWATRYLELTLDPGVTNIDININQALSNKLYYHVLAIQGNNIPDEFSGFGPDYNLSIPNDGYDKVVVVIAGLENGDFFDYAVNVVNPQVNILDPLNGRKAQAGLPTDPEKILVKVDVTNTNAEKIAGIDPMSDFTVTIGAETLDLTDDEVLISQSYIQGQYWLLLRAPNQAANGLYDLTVSYATSTDTEIDAVEYGPVPDTSNVVAIDRSGSMADYDKMPAAQDAGRLYVDTWDVGDQVGVVTFGTINGVDSDVLVGLTDWTNMTRNQAHTEIDGLQALGTQTPIGDGLLDSMNELIDQGEADHEWAIVLLSDGLETVEDYTVDDFLDDYATRKDDGDQVPRVYTVALGPDADFEAMQKIADDTGGTFQYAANAPSPAAMMATNDVIFTELAEIYRVVAEEVEDQQQTYVMTDTIPIADRDHYIPVESGAREAVFVLNFSTDIVDLDKRVDLIGPDLKIYPLTIHDANHLVWRVIQPLAGDWRILMRTFPETGQYLVEASLRSDVILDGYLGLPASERWVGKPMPILASLSEAAPILGATVEAEVINPGGMSWTLDLYDDGLHGDGAADDGFYGTTFYHTLAEGGYIVKLSASGTANIAGDFNRLARLSFYMSKQADDDNDGLPQWWEEEYDCLDTAVDDADSDWDNDGLRAINELFYGTHPCDADTDDGGENDGSEVNEHGSDPHYAPDDRARQPEAKAWPGNGVVTLKYSRPSNFSEMRIYRGIGETGVLSLVADGVTPTGEWLDTAVSNGTTYCYEVVGVISGFSSAPSVKSCATPSVDPVPPPSTAVLIDDNAPQANSTQVVLTLYASDNLDSHEEQEEKDDPAIPENTIPSGVAEMMISNRPDFMGAEWEPYVNQKPWTLDVKNGRAVVYVKFRDYAGNESDVAVDVIYAEVKIYLPIIMKP